MAYVANGRETPPADLVSYKKLRDIKQRVGIAIMRACAQAVIKGFEGSPHAALTAVNRYQGLRGRRGPPVRYGPLRRWALLRARLLAGQPVRLRGRGWACGLVRARRLVGRALL